MVRKSISVVLSLCFALTLVFLPASFGQSQEEVDFILRNNPLDLGPPHKNGELLENEVSEIKLVLFGLMRVYQRYVSSQDKSLCIFTKSCSDFALYSLRKYGLIHGICMASDRLQRCHGLGVKYYLADPETGRAVDYAAGLYYLGKSRE